jgi:hypothetical protein
MVLGVLLFLLIITVTGFVQMAIQQHNHSGIGAVAGGISEASVLLVPLLSSASSAFSLPFVESSAEIHKSTTISSQHRAKMEY